MIVMPHGFGSIQALDDEPAFGAQRVIRLSDAEKIATDRLDGAAEGSLKEALATTMPVFVPSSPRLADRIDEIRRLTETVTLRSFHSAPASQLGWEDAVPPAHAMPLAVVFEAVPDTPDLFADVPAPGVGASWEQAWSAWRGNEELPAATDAVAAPDHLTYPVDADAAVPHADAEPVESRDALLLPVAGSETHGHVDAFAMEDCRAQVVAPIVNAYAENAKLAAEATAASHALHNLKLILTEKMAEDAADLFGPERDAPNDPADRVHPADMAEVDAVAAAPAVVVEPEPAAAIVEEAPQPAADVVEPEMPPVVAKGPPPLPTSAFVSAAAALPAGPPLPQPPPAESAAMPADARAERRFPRPEIAKVPSAPERKAGAGIVATSKPAREGAKSASTKAVRKQKATSKVMRATRSESVRTPLDVGGFMAGFALSGAIGVVLYFVMTAS